MRFHAFIFGLTFSLVATGVAAEQGPPQMLTARVEGYLGSEINDLDLVDFFGSGRPDWGFYGGGAGSIVLRPSIGYLQVDVFGDWSDDTDFFEAIGTVGVGGHAGVVGSKVGLIGLSGGYNHAIIDNGNEFGQGRIGGEGELFLGPVTLGVNAGYSFEPTNSDGLDGYYARGVVRGYIGNNFKIEGVGGVSVANAVSRDVVSPVGRVLLEYRSRRIPVGLFTRWEGFFVDKFNEGGIHTAVMGVRVYFDDATSLQDADRVYFRDSCTFNAGGVGGIRGC